ncbi:MAG: serine hydrolase domain-containing protein [Gemmatimonadota bacterium]
MSEARHQRVTVRAAVQLIVAAAGFTGQLAAQQQDSLPAARTIDELKAQLETIVAKNKLPGVGIALVSRDSLLWAGGVGYADVATKRPITAETHFRVGSVSKSFVALSILMLQQRGKVSLDTKLSEVVPDVKIENPWEATRPLRVVNLLEHTAGFDDMHFNEMYVRSGPADLPMKDVLAINPHSRRVRWEPGTRFSYSNPGYAVAGHVLERVAGMPFEVFIKDSLLNPLGMVTASFVLAASDTAAMAKGYNVGSDRPVGYPPIYLRPAGSLHTSPKELAQLVRMLLNRGTLDGHTFVTPASIDRMERSATTSLAEHGVSSGYGLANYATLNLGAIVHGHSGGIDGFSSEYQYAPDLGVGWVVLVNAGADLSELVRAVARYQLRGRTLPIPPSVQVSAADLEQYAGLYRNESPRAELFRIMTDLTGSTRIYLRGDSLFEGSLFGKGQALIPTAPGVFRAGNEAAGSRAFFAGADGRMVYAGGGLYAVRTSIWPVWLGVVALGLALGLMASALLYVLVWVPKRLLGRLDGGRPVVSARLWPLAAVLLAIGFVAAAMKFGLASGGTFGPATVTITLLSVLFPIVAIIAMIRLAALPRGVVSQGVRRYGVAVSLACLSVAVWLAAYGFIGIRTWTY